MTSETNVVKWWTSNIPGDRNHKYQHVVYRDFEGVSFPYAPYIFNTVAGYSLTLSGMVLWDENGIVSTAIVNVTKTKGKPGATIHVRQFMGDWADKEAVLIEAIDFIYEQIESVKNF